MSVTLMSWQAVGGLSEAAAGYVLAWFLKRRLAAIEANRLRPFAEAYVDALEQYVDSLLAWERYDLRRTFLGEGKQAVLADSTSMVDVLERPRLTPAEPRDPVELEEDGLRELHYVGTWLITQHRAYAAPDQPEKVWSLGTSDREAFDELLRLAGVDFIEACAEGLTWERIGDPLTLAMHLTERGPDRFEAETGAIPLPLRDTVQRQLKGL